MGLRQNTENYIREGASRTSRCCSALWSRSRIKTSETPWCEDDPGMSKMRWKVKPESQYLFLVPRILQFSARAHLLKLHTQSVLPRSCIDGSGNLPLHTLKRTPANYYARPCGGVVVSGTTSRKVAGSNTDEVIEFFNWPNTSSRIMALGSTQPPTEPSTRNFPWGKGADCVENVWASTSHKPMGLDGLLQG
jgi:hypothetical protein